MKKEYDFSRGQRGRFYQPNVELSFPVYLDADIARVVQNYAKRKKVNVDVLVNRWVRREIRSLSPSRTQKER